MNSFDVWTIHFINAFAHHHWVADAVIVVLASNGLFAGGILMSMFWWTWGKGGESRKENRQSLALTLVATTIAVIAARILALNLPYRQRPLHNGFLHFQLPFTSNPHSLIGWSSFPSDHAVLYFCIATGIAIVSKRLGAIAISYAALMSLVRVYIGAHYPTDVIGGALLGSGFAFLCTVASFRRAAARAMDYLERCPECFYAQLFAWTFEIAEMFDSVRHVGLLALTIARKYPSRRFELATALTFMAVLFCFGVWLAYRRHRVKA